MTMNRLLLVSLVFTVGLLVSGITTKVSAQGEETIGVLTGEDIKTPLIDIAGSTSASSNWRDTVGVLAVGYLVSGDQDRRRRQLEIFRRTMERHTGLRVSFRPVKTLDRLIALQIKRRIQYAIHSASSYATAQVLCTCLEPLAVPTDRLGAKGIHAILMTPYNSQIRSINDLRGKRLAIPREPATVTRALPLRRFEESGLDQPGDMGILIDVADPLEGWKKVAAQQADAAIGWSSLNGDLTLGYSSGTLNHLISGVGIAKSTDIRVVWQSRLVPYGPHTIRSDVPTELKKILRTFLTTLQQTNPYVYDAISPSLSGGFVSVTDADFAPITHLVVPRN